MLLLNCLVLCALIGVLLEARAIAVEFEARGVLETERPLARRGDSQRDATLFRVSVRNCKWMIRTFSGESEEFRSYHQMSFDGNEMYIFGLRAKPGGEVRWGGAVGPEVVPYAGPIPRIPVIWFALASSCYLDKHNGRLIPPYSAEVVRVPLVVHITRRTDGARLLEGSIFMDDGFDRKEGNPRKRFPPYDNGFTNAVFSATDFKSLHGEGVPRKFSLVVLRPALGGKASGDLETDLVFRGIITNIASTCSVTNFVPEIPPNTEGFITDTRFAARDAIVPQPFGYRASGWLSADEVSRLPGFSQYSNSQATLKTFIPILVTKQDGSVERRTSAATRRMVVGLMVVSIAFPVLLFLAMKFKKRMAHYEKNKQYGKVKT